MTIALVYITWNCWFHNN